MNRLILASKSPRRIKLLKRLGFKFEIIPSRIEETVDRRMTPEELVTDLSRQKAEAVAAGKADALIVAADTIVVNEGKVLGQPGNPSEAAAMLCSLSDSSHHVFTGVTIIQTDRLAKAIRNVRFYERTKVTFASLTDQEIDAYVRSGSPLDKAGAYGIQDDWGSVFVSGIEGDYYNVVGFPLHKFYQHMKQIAPEVIADIQD